MIQKKTEEESLWPQVEEVLRSYMGRAEELEVEFRVVHRTPKGFEPGLTETEAELVFSRLRDALLPPGQRDAESVSRICEKNVETTDRIWKSNGVSLRKTERGDGEKGAAVSKNRLWQCELPCTEERWLRVSVSCEIPLDVGRLDRPPDVERRKTRSTLRLPSGDLFDVTRVVSDDGDYRYEMEVELRNHGVDPAGYRSRFLHALKTVRDAL